MCNTAKVANLDRLYDVTTRLTVGVSRDSDQKAPCIITVQGAVSEGACCLGTDEKTKYGIQEVQFERKMLCNSL